MITSIKIKNFKGIQSLELPTLSQITIIGGRNNCGKSTTLEAMFMLFDRVNPHILLRQANWRGMGFIPNDEEFMWEPFFNTFDMSKTISIVAKRNNFERKLSIERITNHKSHIPAKNVSSQNLISVDTQDKSSSLNALHLRFFEESRLIEDSYLIQEITGLNLEIKQSIQGKREMVSYFGARTPSNQNEDAERLGRVEIEDKTDKIIEILQTIVPEITGVKAIRIADASLIYVNTGKGKMKPISYMGDGVSRLLTIALGIASCKDSFLLIDEIENGLHYSVMPKIWSGIAQAAKLFNCQIICTTHSLECVSAASKALQDTNHDYCYIRLEKQNDNISGKFFDKDVLNYAIETEMEIR